MQTLPPLAPPYKGGEKFPHPSHCRAPARVAGSTSPRPSLEKRGKEFVRTCWRSVAFGLAPPGNGEGMEDEQEACRQRNEPTFYQGAKVPTCGRPLLKWSEPPPLCKGREGGVESPAQRACSWSTGVSPSQDSTSPDPSLQKRGKVLWPPIAATLALPDKAGEGEKN